MFHSTLKVIYTLEMVLFISQKCKLLQMWTKLDTQVCVYFSEISAAGFIVKRLLTWLSKNQNTLFN